MVDILQARVTSLTVKREGTDVILFLNGAFVARLPWQAADAVARALQVKARQAEEEDSVEAIVNDQALLMRLGVPLVLTGRGDIVEEAKKEAAWDFRLRRLVPLRGIRSGVALGRPSLIVHNPKE